MASPRLSDRNSKQKSYQDRREASSRFYRHLILLLSLFLLYQLTTTFFIKSYYNTGRGMEPTIARGKRMLASPLLYGPVLWGGYRLSTYTTPNRGDIVLTQSPIDSKMGVLSYLIQPFVSFFSFQFITMQNKKASLNLPETILKRVIALPGDTIKMENSVIFVKPAGQLYFISEFEHSDRGYEIERIEVSTELEQPIPFNNFFDEVTLREGEFFVIGDNRSLINDSRSFGYINLRDIRAKVITQY